MIERHVTFNVLPGRGPDFEALFASEYRPAMSTMPGFVAVELIRDQESQAQYTMVIRFQSMETAAAWRASDAHQALKPKIGALYEGSTVKVFDVIA